MKWVHLFCAGDLGANVDQLEAAVKVAAKAGAQLILFPELFLTGYCMWLIFL
jgi:predicted amidohydrolase